MQCAVVKIIARVNKTNRDGEKAEVENAVVEIINI